VDEPVPTRFDYWSDIADQVIGPVELRPSDDPDFRDLWRLGRLGAVGVHEGVVTRGGALRYREHHVRRADRDGMFMVTGLVRGTMGVEQDDRQAVLRPGDLAVVDLSRPSRVVLGPCRTTSVVFPREQVPLHADALTARTASRIRGDRGMGALASSFLRGLPQQLDAIDDVSGARLGTTVADLLTATVTGCSGPGSRAAADGHRHALLAQIRTFIELHLGDPDLAPARIAAENHISIRYLHKLFESEETSVADWIRRRRLERCRGDLLDPRLRGRPVAAIAARWGFRDPAYFNRVFRATYGAPPGRFRDARLLP
jgi:AraC-like DNA-binding protein